jgi:hypothetical protein
VSTFVGLSFCFSAKAQSWEGFRGTAYYSNANITAATANQDSGLITGFIFKPANDINYYKNFTIVINPETQFFTNLVVRHIKIDSINVDTTVVQTGREYQLSYNTIESVQALTAYCLLNIQYNFPLFEASNSYLSVWGGQIDVANRKITNPEKIYIFLNYYVLNDEIIQCWR